MTTEVLVFIVTLGAAAEVLRRAGRGAHHVYLRRRQWRADLLASAEHAAKHVATASEATAALRAEVATLSGALLRYVVSAETKATGVQEQINDLRTLVRLRRGDTPRDPGTERRAGHEGNPGA